MVTLIGRTKGLRIRGLRIERVFSDDRDYERPVITRLASLIENSSPIHAAELAHASSGLALAERLLEEDPGETVFLVSSSLVASQASRLTGARLIPVWMPLDFAAILVRFTLRALTRPTALPRQLNRVLFVTNARHRSQVSPYLEGELPVTINLRTETLVRRSLRELTASMVQSWREAAGLPLAARVRLTRLLFEAEVLEDLFALLRERGMKEAFFADITGHRVRLLADLCVEGAITTSILQHGRATNVCRYLPPKGVHFVSFWETDLTSLRNAVARSDLIDWVLISRLSTSAPTRGRDVLVCPSFLGSRERFSELRSLVHDLKEEHETVGIRFHPTERFKRLKALVMGVELVSSKRPFVDLEERWGVGVVPFKSTASDDLVQSGFRLLEVDGSSS